MSNPTTVNVTHVDGAVIEGRLCRFQRLSALFVAKQTAIAMSIATTPLAVGTAAKTCLRLIGTKAVLLKQSSSLKTIR